MAVVEGDPFGPVNRCPVQPKGSGAVFASPEMGDHQGSVSMIPLADDGISVVLIHPGHVKTDMGGPNAEITPEESGSGIIDVIDNTSLETTGAFMKWNGEPHNW